MFPAQSKLWSYREIGESSVVKSVCQSCFTAAPMGAGINCDSKPTTEINGKTGAGATRIRFQTAVDWEQRSWKLPVQIGAWIKERVSAEKFYLRSRCVLCCGDGGKYEQ